MSRAFVFPGQGSQAVGMGADLADAFATARDVFQEVDEALKQNLSKLMREGPESDLVLTENAQPALMAVSVAVVRILEKDGGKPLSALASHVAGHSLGEYSALAAAGALQLADAARLLKLRGQSMQKAVPVGVGAMAALLGIELEAGAGGLQGGRAGRGRRGRQRQWRRPGRGERPQGGGRAHDRGGQAARRQARHAAAGERALPLPADAARRRRDAGGAGEGDRWRRRACR